MSKDSSAKYYQNNKERLQIKADERYKKNNAKIYQKMKSKKTC